MNVHIHIIDSVMSKFIKNRTPRTNDEQSESNINNNTLDTDSSVIDANSNSDVANIIINNKPKKFMVLPYTNYKGEEFASKLTKLVNDNFEVDFRVSYPE